MLWVTGLRRKCVLSITVVCSGLAHLWVLTVNDTSAESAGSLREPVFSYGNNNETSTMDLIVR